YARLSHGGDRYAFEPQPIQCSLPKADDMLHEEPGPARDRAGRAQRPRRAGARYDAPQLLGGGWSAKRAAIQATAPLAESRAAIKGPTPWSQPNSTELPRRQRALT